MKSYRKVRHQFNLCNIRMELFDEFNNCLYIIEGPLCQLGVWATRLCTCDVCQKAFFFIRDPKNFEKIVGLIEKVIFLKNNRIFIKKKRSRGIVSVIVMLITFH